MLSLKVGSGAEGSGSLPGSQESPDPLEEKSLSRKAAAAAEGIGGQQQQQHQQQQQQQQQAGE